MKLDVGMKNTFFHLIEISFFITIISYKTNVTVKKQKNYIMYFSVKRVGWSRDKVVKKLYTATQRQQREHSGDNQRQQREHSGDKIRPKKQI